MLLPVLTCPKCGKKFGLLVGTGVDSPDRLSDPFDAICIHCEPISGFHKVAVQNVSVDRPGLRLEDEFE